MYIINLIAWRDSPHRGRQNGRGVETWRKIRPINHSNSPDGSMESCALWRFVWTSACTSAWRFVSESRVSCYGAVSDQLLFFCENRSAIKTLFLRELKKGSDNRRENINAERCVLYCTWTVNWHTANSKLSLNYIKYSQGINVAVNFRNRSVSK